MRNFEKYEPSVKNILINSLEHLIANKVVQQYNKHNVKSYCTFIATIIIKIDEPELVLNFLGNDFVFHKHIVSEDDFCVCFLETCMQSLIEVAIKFKDNEIFHKISDIIQRVSKLYILTTVKRIVLLFIRIKYVVVL